jgi:hypothetical protein
MPPQSLELRETGRRPQRVDQARRVVSSLVRPSIDEDARSSLNTALDPAFDIDFDPRQASPVSEISTKPDCIQIDGCGVSNQVLIRQGALVAKQQLMHLPEPSLEVRCLGCQGRVERVRMNLGQREIAKRKDERSAKLVTYLRHADQRLPRVRAFVVAVDEQPHRCASHASRMVAGDDVRLQ